MKKHLPSAAVLSVLLLVLCLHAFAAERSSFDSGLSTSASSGGGYIFTQSQEPTYTDYTDVIPVLTAAPTNGNLRTAPDITVNGTSIGHLTDRIMAGGTTYVEAAPILQVLYPDISLTTRDGHLTATSSELSFHAMEGDCYFLVNDRYLYVPDGVLLQGESILLPADRLAEALGCSIQGNADGQDIILKQVEPAVTARTYNADDLYWLSHAIFAESGNQPMKGRIAVGTVILNRVADPTFPNTVEAVIFQPNQFSPVDNGTIYRDPDKDSIVAAKLCLDGVKEADDCLYFNVTTMYSWADRARTYFCTIGGHNFYL
ncbi:MAG: cell wall hydrolase [Ruminiclostridium sp.]|nr:cell wall hydrolase [Ruminiclostridium sp.]MBQ9933143.1 cell wall hydrolase [Ruminiclostridium sp.]